jgi:cytochrome c5
MSKALKRLLLSIILLILVSACRVEPSPVAQITNSGQTETLPSQVESTPTSAVDPSTAAPGLVQPTAAAPDDPSIAAAEAQALLNERCKRCHSLQRVTSFKGDLAAWEIVVNDMIDRGADLSDEEKAILLQFLVENYK